MNWKLIFSLSLFGLAMAFATVFFIPTKWEWTCWLPIFIFCAYVLAKNLNGKYFINAFFVSVMNCFWIVTVHFLLWAHFLILNPDIALRNADMPMPTHPRIMMSLFGMVIGIVSGCVLGLFTLAAKKMMKK